MLIIKVYSLSAFHSPMCMHAQLKLTKTVRRMNVSLAESLGSKSFPPQVVGRFKVTDPDREANVEGRRMPQKSAVPPNSS